MLDLVEMLNFVGDCVYFHQSGSLVFLCVSCKRKIEDDTMFHVCLSYDQEFSILPLLPDWGLHKIMKPQLPFLAQALICKSFEHDFALHHVHSVPHNYSSHAVFICNNLICSLHRLLPGQLWFAANDKIDNNVVCLVYLCPTTSISPRTRQSEIQEKLSQIDLKFEPHDIESMEGRVKERGGWCPNGGLAEWQAHCASPLAPLTLNQLWKNSAFTGVTAIWKKGNPTFNCYCSPPPPPLSAGCFLMRHK